MARITTAIAFQKHHPRALIARIIANLPSGFATAPVVDAITDSIYTGGFDGILEFCTGKVNHFTVLLAFKINHRGSVEILQVWRNYANIWDVLNMAQIAELESVCKDYYRMNQNPDTECDVTSAIATTKETSL